MHWEELNKQYEFLDNLSNEVLGKWKNSWRFATAVHPYFVFKSDPIGYHSNTTHEDVMKDLICTGCRKVPIPLLPVTVFECKHVYCDGCRWVVSCCGTQQQSNTHIVTNLKQLSMVCPHVIESEVKCFWTGSLEAWREHLDSHCPVKPLEPKRIAENCDKIAEVASELVKVKKELEDEKQRRAEVEKDFEAEKQRRIQVEKDLEAEKQRRIKNEEGRLEDKQKCHEIEQDYYTEQGRRVQAERHNDQMECGLELVERSQSQVGKGE
ncbi:hypothetical protein HDU99_001192 [Rhizoclosmatium hyalinum]|nr:hypothetical protein HDU99_001192 [Rhizoclosmatium hyalinum]